MDRYRKTTKANKIIYSLTVAFSILTFFVFEGLSVFPEWAKGLAIILEILGAVFLVPKVLARESRIIDDVISGAIKKKRPARRF